MSQFMKVLHSLNLTLPVSFTALSRLNLRRASAETAAEVSIFAAGDFWEVCASIKASATDFTFTELSDLLLQEIDTTAKHMKHNTFIIRV